MSEKVRVHEVAKELGITSKEVIEKAKDIGIEVKAAQSSITMQQAEELANYIINGAPTPKPKPKKTTVKKSSKPKEEAKKEETKVDKKEEKSSHLLSPISVIKASLAFSKSFRFEHSEKKSFL